MPFDGGDHSCLKPVRRLCDTLEATRHMATGMVSQSRKTFVLFQRSGGACNCAVFLICNVTMIHFLVGSEVGGGAEKGDDEERGNERQPLFQGSGVACSCVLKISSGDRTAIISKVLE